MRNVKSVRGWVLALLYASFTALALLSVSWVAKNVTAQFDKQMEVSGAQPDSENVTQIKNETRKQLVQKLFADDDAELADALLAVPLVLLFVFKLTLRFLPLYTGVMGFDLISAEIGPRSMRYLVVRARRSSVLLGKLLAQATLLAGLMLLVDIALVAFGKIDNADFSISAAATTFARFWIASLFFAAPYLALTHLCSTAFRQSAVSLVMNVMALFGIWLVAALGSLFAEDSIPGMLRYASIWHYGGNLLNPAPLKFAVAAAAHLGFTALFTVGAYLVLRWRDL